MDWTGATNFPFFEAANVNIELKIYGSLTLAANVNFVFNGRLTFTSFTPGKTIHTFSYPMQCPIEFNGAGGEWTLLDSLTTTKDIKLTYGTLRTNNNNIRAKSFTSYNNNVRGLYLGTSVVSLTTMGYAWFTSRSIILDADSSVIKCRDNGLFHSEGHVYNILEFDSSSISTTSNIVKYDSLYFKKIISHNSVINSWLEMSCYHSYVDTIIARANLDVDKGHHNFFNHVSVNRNCNIFTSGAGPSWGDSIMSLTVNGNTEIGYYGGPNNYIHDFTGYGNLIINPGDNSSWSQNLQTFDSCYVGGNATIMSANNHLGIFTMTPGKTLTLKNDSTQYIDSLSATGNPGFPIQVISSDLGLAANVVIQEDLCTNYLYIHAVHATSPNLLYVGPNSNDVANNLGWIFTNCLPTGMEENHDGSLTIFPNPATNQLTIENGKLKMEMVEIYDVVGQRVLSQQQTISNKLQTVDVSELKPGVYFVKVKDAQQEYLAKFVKE